MITQRDTESCPCQSEPRKPPSAKERESVCSALTGRPSLRHCNWPPGFHDDGLFPLGCRRVDVGDLSPGLLEPRVPCEGIGYDSQSQDLQAGHRIKPFFVLLIVKGSSHGTKNGPVRTLSSRDRLISRL